MKTEEVAAAVAVAYEEAHGHAGGNGHDKGNGNGERERAREGAKLSRSAMETLAIVAYKEHVVRGDIEQIRGVDSAAVLKTLLERRLVRIVGRKDAPGRPIMYGTTRQFLQTFGLKDLSDLPALRDIKELKEAEPFTLQNLDQNGDASSVER